MQLFLKNRIISEGALLYITITRTFQVKKWGSCSEHENKLLANQLYPIQNIRLSIQFFLIRLYYIYNLSIAAIRKNAFLPLFSHVAPDVKNGFADNAITQHQFLKL